jgi:hypothetical protein
MTNTTNPNSITNEVQTQLQEKYKGILAAMQELLSELAQNLETKEDPRVLKGAEGYISDFEVFDDGSYNTLHRPVMTQATWFDFEDAQYAQSIFPEDHSYQILRYNDLIIPEVNRLLKELQGIEKVLKVLMKEPKQRGRKVKPAEDAEVTSVESTESQAPF